MEKADSAPENYTFAARLARLEGVQPSWSNGRFYCHAHKYHHTFARRRVSGLAVWSLPARNPGINQEYACTVLSRWSDRLDDFYDRAEAMGVSESDLADLWEARLEKMLPEVRACEYFVMAAMPNECAHSHELICLRALPECQGRCSHFQLTSVAAKGQGIPPETHPERFK